MEEDRVVKKRAPKTVSYTHVEAYQFQEILKDPRPEGRLMNLMDKGWDGLTVYDRLRGTFTTALYLAAEAEKAEDTPVLRWLLRWSGTKVDDILEADSSNGRTALHAAASNGENVLEVLIIELLNVPDKDRLTFAEEVNGIEIRWLFPMDDSETPEQVEVNVPDKEGNTPLHIAVEKKNINAMKILLRFHADPCRNNTKGVTPLHLAVRGCELEVLKELFGIKKKNLVVDTPDLEKEQTPLHLAVEADWKDMVALLIEKGADPCRKDKEGASSLCLAALKGHESVFQLLLHASLKTRFQEATSVEDINNALEELRSLALKCDWNDTALHLASESGNVSLVQALLTNVNAVVKENGLGDTALHAAASGGFLEIVEVLLKAGAETNKQNKLGQTALHAAASGGFLEIVEVLLKAGAEINKQNKLGQTALHFAIGKGRVDIADTLLKSGAHMDIRDNTGAGVLHFAARRGGEDILEWLSKCLHNGMDVNQATDAGLTPLHFAAWNGNDEALKWLLKNKSIKLDAVDKVEKGMPWQWAAMGGSCDCLESLISEHVKRGIKVLPGSHKDWKRAFQCIENHKQASLMDGVAWTFLSELKGDHLVLEPGILSCAAAYGDSFTNKRLVSVLVAGKSNQPTMEMVRKGIQKLVEESRLLEWAACTPFIRGPEFNDEARFNEVQPVVEFLMKYPDVKAINNQLKLAFKSVFKAKGMETFASCMAECCTMALPDMIKEAVRGEVIDFESKNLSNKYKDGIGGGSDLVEDVPVAYWVARLEEDRSKDLKNMSHKKEDDDEGEQRKLLAQRAEDLLKKFMKDYPNDKGPRTGRTALHWATIFGERETMIALSAKGCKPEIGDDFGKAPYWDVQKEDTVLLNCLKWSDYTESLHNDRQMFVDGLNAILVGSALIASVTFGGFLNPPLGYNMKFKNIEYAYIDKTGVVVFWVANSLSFFFALASALAGVTGVLPSPDKFDLKVIRRLRFILIVAAFMLVLSIIFVLVAFGAAGLSTLPPLQRYQRNMIVTSVPGALVCFAPLCAFIYAIYNLNPRKLRVYIKLFIEKCLCIGTLQKLLGGNNGMSSGNETLEELLNLSSPPQISRRHAPTGLLPWEDGLDSLVQLLQIDRTQTAITVDP